MKGCVVGMAVVETVMHLLGERVSVTEMLRVTETVWVATLLDAAGEGDRVIETDTVRVTETVYVLDAVTVRVNGFVVTTGLPVTVMVLLPEMVMEGETVFVAKLVVGAGDAVKVTEGVKEPLGERSPLAVEQMLADCVGLRRLLTLGETVADRPVLPDTAPVGLTVGLPVARLADTAGDPVTDCIVVGLTLTEPVLLRRAVGVATEADELMLGVTLPVELLAGLGVTTGLDDPRGVAVAHCDMEEDTLLDPVGL